MTTTEYIEAKYAITNACNSTGLPPEELVGVLSAVLSEAREQMCLNQTVELLQAQDEVKRLQELLKDKEAENGNGQRNSDEEGSRS